jgi:hypothetical protein
MIEVEVDNRMRQIARERAERLGKMRGSIRKGAGNLIGCIGCELVKKLYPFAVEVSERHSNLLRIRIIDNRFFFVALKGKGTKVEPKPEYDCSVTATAKEKQKCDFFFFTRVNYEYTKGWVLGFMPREEYFARARFLKAGEYDATNKYNAKADCYNLKISELYELPEDEVALVNQLDIAQAS